MSFNRTCSTVPLAWASMLGRRLGTHLALTTFALLLGSQMASAAAPPGDWWDASYAWRRKITLTDSGTGTPAGTVVSLTVNHAALVSAGKSQADGDDLRIAHWDGANWTELSRALASGSAWNNAATQVLFKTAAATAASGSSDDYYLYVGNASVTAPAVSVPTARSYKAEQLAEQSTASTTFVDVPGTTLTFTPGAATETWLIFVSGVIRSNNVAATSVEMRLLINGVEVDLWGHQNNDANAVNGAGFLIPERITGTAALQTIQPQFRAAVGTSYARSVRVVAALVPPGADLQFAETDATAQLMGTNLALQSLTFTPPTPGDYLIFGKMSQHENPGSSTAQGWLLDDAGNLHPDAPAGTGYSNARAPWQPIALAFRRTLPASSRTFALRGTSSGPGTENSEWQYRRLMAFRTDAWEAAEYNESLAQTTTTSNTFQTKNSLTTAVPPAARDYLVIQAERISGSSATTTVQKSGELRDGGSALVRTDHRMDRDGTNTQGYHHVIGVANIKRTAAAVTYDNGFLSPNASTVECAESTICSLRYRDAASGQGADEPVPTVTWTAASQSALESAGTMTVTAQLSAVSAHNVTVPFTLTGTASDPADYAITASPITITAGATTASLTITIVNDAVDEPDETVIVTMGNPTGAVQGATTTHTATITDNDTAGVTITQSGTTDVTEGGVTDTYTIVLTSQPTANVTITIGTDGKATAAPSPLTFTAANWNTPQTVTVTAVNDAVAQGAHTSTITHAAASADPYYNAIAVANVTATITDNDVAGVTITESAGTTNVTEGGATDTYTVLLTSQPIANVTITIGTDGQASVNPASLTFTAANWNVPQTVTVTAVNDAVAEGAHTSTITHAAASADPNYNAIAVASVTANITDNDTAGVTITESGGTTNVTEGGATDTYTVVLHSQPTANVTITISTDGQASANPTPLTFTAATWNVPQTVTVTATDNPDIDGPHTSTITHAAASADPNYNAIVVAGVTANITDNDTAGVVITESGGTTDVTEGGATDTYTLALHSRPTANVTVTVTPGAKASIGAGFGVAAQLTFTAANWNNPQTVTVTALDDALIEGLHISTITHTTASADANYNALAVANVIANITDNDIAYANFSLAAQSAIETTATMTVDVTIPMISTNNVTVPFTVTGTAANPADYTITASPVTILAGQLSATITITINDDFFNEPDETVILTMGNPTNGTKGTVIVHTATIIDNEPPGVTITESLGSTTVTEGGATDSYTLVLQSQPLANVDIAIATDGKTTVAPVSVTFTGANWNVPQTITVTAVNDFVAQGAHASLISHTLTSADGDYNGLAIGDVTATITDNDVAGVTITQSGTTDVAEGGATDTYTVVLTSQPIANVTVAAGTDGGTTVNPSPLTFTAANWNVPQTVTVTAVNDFIVEGAHTSTITHATASVDPNYNAIAVANVTANITDNDTAGVTITESGGTTDITEGGATDTYAVVLTSQPIANVTITICPDSQATVNPASLTFTSANWSNPQTVTVTAVDDFLAQGPHASTITHATASADPNYNVIAVASVTATITDNDTAAVVITESGGTTNVTEGGATDTYTVVLHSQPAANVTITVSPDAQATVNPAAVTFTAATWNVPQTVTVTAVNDFVAEGPHTSSIGHTAASVDPNYNAIAVAGVTANITDNDTAGITVAPVAGLVTTEAGGTDTFTIVLNSQPTANVTIGLNSSDLAEGTVAPASVTFTAATWNVPQTVTVTGVDDFFQDGDIAYTILTAAAISADPMYSGLDPQNVSVTNIDNDTAGVVITESGGTTTIAEGGATDTYSVVLHSRPTANVTITITPDAQSGVGAGPGVARQLVFTGANWNVPQVVTVTATDDPDIEGPHTSTITHVAASADANYNAIAVAGVTANITDNDTAGVVITESGGTTDVTEGGATDTYTLALHSRPTANVTVTVTPGAKASIGAGFGVAAQLTFTAANWNNPQTVTVTALDDALIEGLHISTITHTTASADPNYNALAVANVTANITDNDIAYANFSLAAQSAIETTATMTVDVTIPMISTNNVTVPFTVTGTASNPADYTITASPVTIPAGQLSATITITINDDFFNEPDETVILTMGNPTNGTKGTVTVHTATIIDNEPPGVTIAESLGSTTVTEGGATDSYTLVLRSQPLANVDIAIATDGKTTVAPVSVTFTGADWNVPQTITVTAVDDFVAEGAHASVIAHTLTSADATYNALPTANVTATVTDDDVAGVTITQSGTTDVTEGGATDTYTIVLTSQPTANVTITIATDGQTAVNPSPLTFTAANWNTPQTVTVTAVNDFIVEGAHTSTITHATASVDPNYNALALTNVTANITDNDTAGVTITESGGTTDITEGGAIDTYTVVLTSQPIANVTITVSPDAQTTVNPASLTFTAATWNVPQSVTVTAVDDLVAEGAHISAITHFATSADLNYNALAVAGVTAHITDNDTAGVTITESGGTTNVTEGGVTDTYTIALHSQPTANVTITVGTDGQATVNPTSLTFTAATWNVPQTVTVTAVDDAVAEGAHTSTITHAAASADANYNALAGASVTANITDNDTAGVTITESGGTTNVTEGGATDTYTIVLHSQPTANVTISVSTDGKTTVSAASLTFTTATWNVPRIVTVTAVDDFVAEGLHTSTIGHTAASVDPNYNAIAVAGVTANITDNDTAGITVAPVVGLVTTEAGGTATFTIVLSSQPTANVTIGLSSSDLAEGTVAPAAVTFTAGTWNVPQTVTVTGVNDFVQDGNIAYTILTAPAVSADPNYGGLDAQNVAVTNTDNDVAGITVAPVAGLVTTEAGGTDTFTIVLNSQPTANVIIGLSSGNLSEGTVAPAAVTFTAANWNVPQTVTVTGVDDFVQDGSIAYTILTAPAISADPVYSGLDAQNVAVTNTDDDTAGITVAPVAGLVTTEAGGTATFTIALNAQPTANVTIGLSSSDLVEGTVAPAAVTFTAANWNVPQTVTVTGVDDFVQDGSIAYTILTAPAVSADPVYSGMDPQNVAVTNTDDDTAGITVAPVAGLVTTEAGGTTTFTIVLNSQPTANVTIGLSSSDLAEGTVAPAAVTFTAANWNVPQTVTITGVNDFVQDGNIAYTILTAPAVSADPNYSGMDPQNVAVTNTDNDVAGITVTPTSGLVTVESGGTATFTIVLNSQPTADVTIGLSSSNTGLGLVSPPSVTFTAANWNIPQTVTASGIGDFVQGGNSPYTILTAPAVSADPKYNGMDPADVSVTNLDDDTVGIAVSATSGLVTTESGGTATFTITLNSQPTADVAVAISSSNPAEGTVSPASVTFTPVTWRSPQTITVTGVDDLVQDGDVAYTILTASAGSADSLYNGLHGPDVHVTNLDNDTCGIAVTPTAGLVTTESGGTATFVIVLRSQPTADVTIALSSSNPAEGIPSPAGVTFTPQDWTAPQTVTVRGVDDLVQDGNVGYTILTAPAVSADPNYNGLNPPDVSVTNTDNDTAGITVTPTSGLVTSESGAAATFTIVLNTQPAADVSIALHSDKPTEATVSPAVVTFTTLNWNTPQRVTATGVDDLTQDGDVPFTILTDPAVSADPNYSGLDAPDVAAVNRDNDTSGVTMFPTEGLVISQVGGQATVTIVLNTRPIADVTLALTSSNPAEAALSPIRVTFTPANWNVPQAVTVIRLDANAVAGNTSFTITMAAVSADPTYNGLAAAGVPVTNDRSTDDVTVEIHRITHGMCGPIGYIPLLLAVPYLLGMKLHYRRARRRPATRPGSKTRNC